MKRTARMYKAAVGVALFFALTFTLARPAFTQTTIPAPGVLPSGLAYDGTFLYVSDVIGFRTIYKLDPTTGVVLESFLAPSPAGLFDGHGLPSGLVADGEGRLFVSDVFDTVYEIDDAGTTIFNSFSLPFRGGAIAFDGTNLYIGDFDSSQVLVTDRLGNVIRTFDSGLRAAGMVFDPTTGHLSVISVFDATVSEITTDGQSIRSCDGPRDPGVSTLGLFGGIARVGSQLYIAEVSDPDPFTPPDLAGTIFIVDPGSLTCTPPFNPDLALSLIDTPDPVVVGSTLTYTLIIVNNGPGAAAGVVMTDKLPAGVTLLGAVASQGACGSLTTGTITCELESLANAASATVTIQVRPTVVGTVTTKATVTVAATELDPNLADNTATASTTVIGKADLALSLVDTPDPVVVGSTLTYSLIIVNNGSEKATDVVVTHKLPTGVTLLGAVASQGVCGSDTPGTVTCKLGTLANGAGARAAIRVRPTGRGPLSSKASVEATEFDPNLTDNTATASTTVILP